MRTAVVQLMNNSTFSIIAIPSRFKSLWWQYAHHARLLMTTVFAGGTNP
jgi:Na+/H+ antiporter NhaC